MLTSTIENKSFITVIGADKNEVCSGDDCVIRISGLKVFEFCYNHFSHVALLGMR